MVINNEDYQDHVVDFIDDDLSKEDSTNLGLSMEYFSFDFDIEENFNSLNFEAFMGYFNREHTNSIINSIVDSVNFIDGSNQYKVVLDCFITSLRYFDLRDDIKLVYFNQGE